MAVVTAKHRFNKWSKRISWHKCSACGLVALRNQNTAQAIKQGCDNDLSD